MKTELRVGVFVIVGLAILAYIMISMGEWPFFGDQQQTYRVVALFSNVVGLNVGAEVVLSGVKIGEVLEIGLEGQRARVVMAIRGEVDFPANSEARISSIGLLGQAIVEIIPGDGEGPSARQVGEVGTQNPVTLDQLVSVLSGIGEDVTDVTRSIRDFLGFEGGSERIQETMEHLLAFSEQLDQLVRENRLQLKRSVDSLELLAVSMRDRLPTVIEDLHVLTSNLRQIFEERGGDVDETLGRARELVERLDGAAVTLQEILDKINEGEGAVSMLLNEPDTVEQAQDVLQRADSLIGDLEGFLSRPSRISLDYGFRSQYYARSEDFKNYFRLTINFTRRDSFSFVLINDQIRNQPPVLLPGDEEGGLISLSDEFTFSATYGWRFRGGTIRFGLIESSTGVALDLGSDENRLFFTLEGYNFGRERGPHISLASHLRLWQGLFLTIGYDDPVDRRRGQLFFGGGYRF